MADKIDTLIQALKDATAIYLRAKEDTVKAKKREAAALNRAVKAQNALERERKRVIEAL